MMSVVIIECSTVHALVLFMFLLTVRQIRMFFSLKPSLSQGESSLKISARWGSPFWRSQGTNKQTNKHTHSLTDWCFDREIKLRIVKNIHQIFSSMYRKSKNKNIEQSLLSLSRLKLLFTFKITSFATSQYRRIDIMPYFDTLNDLIMTVTFFIEDLHTTSE